MESWADERGFDSGVRGGSFGFGYLAGHSIHWIFVIELKIVPSDSRNQLGR